MYVCTPFLMRSDGKKEMSYLLEGESPIIKHSGNSKSVSSILCLFGSGKSFSWVVREPNFCARTESFSSQIFRLKIELFELRDVRKPKFDCISTKKNKILSFLKKKLVNYFTRTVHLFRTAGHCLKRSHVTLRIFTLVELMSQVFQLFNLDRVIKLSSVLLDPSPWLSTKGIVWSKI